MGSIEDNKWVDMIIDKIGSALLKVDKSIQKGIELWAELTKDMYDDQLTRNTIKDMYDDQLTHNTTGQPNNGKSGEEDSFQDKSVAEVKERQIQQWATCFCKAKEIPNQHRAMCIGEPKDSPSQHWAMCASKIPESLIRVQGDEDCYENDCDDDDDYYNEEKEKEEEEDETTVSESSKDMRGLNLRTSTTSYRPNCNHHHNEEASGSSLKWKDGYELLIDVDTPYGAVDELWNGDYDEDETTVSNKSRENMWKTKSREHLWKIYNSGRPLGPCYVPPIHPLHNENDALYQKRRNPYQLPKNDNTWDYDDDDDDEEEETSVSESCGKMSEFNLKTSATSYIPFQYQHHRNEEDGGSSWWAGRSGYEMLKNDDTSWEEDGDSSWDNEEEVKEWIRKHGMMSDVSNVSLVGHEDEDKLQGFVNVKEEDSLNNSELDEVETISPECDWVYVTRD